jgi:hypothetical protein
MVQGAITKSITTLNEAEAKFNLRRTENEQFFREWFADLPELTQEEQTALDQIKARYRYHRADGPLAEGAVNLIVVSRLLELAGFYDPPFKIRAEVSVEVTTEVEDEILRGRLDFLVVLNQFWVVVIESKHTDFDIELAIPQTLAYMMAMPHPDRPVFGMVTNGGTFAFLKLTQQALPQYDISDVFSLLPRRNQLYEVLQVLKRVGKLIENRASGVGAGG